MRYWNNQENDDGSIHAIGNGKFLVYGKGPEINQFQGPPYSAPAYGALQISENERHIQCVSERLKGTSLWQHSLSDKNTGQFIAEFYDGMDPEYNVFERRFRSEAPITLHLELMPYTEMYFYKDYELEGFAGDCIVLVIKKGEKFFGEYALRDEIRMLIMCEGSVSFDKESKLFLIEKGEGRLLFSSDEPLNMVHHISLVLKGRDVFAQSSAFFAGYLKHGEKVRKSIPQDHPERKRIEDALESVAVLIKCQQSNDGGIIAGHFYPMAYVRDQAGTMRGLLKMGYIEEAKKVLDYWFAKWNAFGTLLNAESMGHHNDRHMFLDEVEVPGFIVLCVFEYLDTTGDEAYIKCVYPMLKWGVNTQLGHLISSMTCFSGDETYIAGWTLPRTCINHGSADSTLLYIEGATRFLDFSKKYGLLSENEFSMIESKTLDAKKRYKDNFMKDGILYGNNPHRLRLDGHPRFYKGFCPIHLMENRGAPHTWLERGEHDYYRCPECFTKKLPPQTDPDKLYLLGSTSMLPPYYHSDILTKEETEKNIKPFLDAFNEKGYVSSNYEGARSLGYDFGLFLYNLAYLNKPEAEKALKVMLDMVDGTGAWVEYYDNMTAVGCRCRPWESAINIEAMLYYLDHMK